MIPGDDISSDLNLSGCNINTDNEEEEESYTKLIDMLLDIQLDRSRSLNISSPGISK